MRELNFVDLSGHNIRVMIKIEARRTINKAHCGKCKGILDFRGFIGDFHNRCYIVGHCSKCSEDYIVVFQYSQNKRKQNHGKSVKNCR